MQVLAVLMCYALIPLIDSRGSPPDFSNSKWPKGTEYVRTPESKVIRCHAEANPPAKTYHYKQPEWLRSMEHVGRLETTYLLPRYRLTFNGESITWNAEILTFSAEDGTLTTGPKFNKQHNGEYQCTAYNDYGTIISSVVNLTTAVHGPFIGDIDTEVRDVFESKYIKLDCEGVEENVPDPQFSWFRGISRDPGEYKAFDFEDRMVIDRKGNLHFLWTEMRDSYSYTCATYNSVFLSTKRNPRIIKLDVKQGSKDDREPQLKYEHNLEVHAGQNAELMCIFTYFSKQRGNKLTINWYHRGEKVHTGQSFTLTSVMLPSDTQDQEGEYLCEAVLGQTKVFGRVNLKIVGPPVFLDKGAPGPKTVPMERDAVIKCQTRSHKSYSYPPVWLRDGKPIIGCLKYFFDCKSRNPAGQAHCISEKKVCNTYPDCDDGNDEDICLGGSCLESQKKCGNECISKYEECPDQTCNYPDFMCQFSRECIAKVKICDGEENCKDGSDELACPGRSVTKVGRFLFSSDRTQLTVPSVGPEDSTCFQCIVGNEYGSVIGDACVTVIDKILALKLPNGTYNVKPGSRLEILVEATTDRDWLNQMDYVWEWFEYVTDKKTGKVSTVRVSLPPRGKTKDYFHISQKGKNMTIVFPEGKDDETEAVYLELIDREYSLVIKHPFDRVEFNFTINGKGIIKPEPVVETASTNLWFIAIILGIIVLFVIVALIVCIMYRNRGGKYLVDEKERKAGHDPVQELMDGGFHDVGRVEGDGEDPEKAEKVSLTESVKPYESDDDPTDEYGGDFDVSKFNEEGSFIGAYGESRGREATV